MRKILAAVCCLLGYLATTTPVAMGYDWALGDKIEVSLRGDLTYWARIRTESAHPDFVTPGSTTFCSGNANFGKGSLTNNAIIGTLELRADIPLRFESPVLYWEVMRAYDRLVPEIERINTPAANQFLTNLSFYLKPRQSLFGDMNILRIMP